MFTSIFARRLSGLALLALLVPCAAHAQFGGFIKRAIGEKVLDKVAEKVTKKPEGQHADSAAGTIVPGSAATVQLTSETLESTLRGLDVMARIAGNRDSLVGVADRIGKRLADLSSANADVIRSYREKAGLVSKCR